MAKKRRGHQEVPPVPTLDAETQARVDNAVTMLEAGDFVEAIGLLEPLREEHPRTALIYKLLGSAYADLGVPNAAAERWEEGAKLDPADEHLWRFLAGAYGQIGSYTHALRALRRYHALEPDGEPDLREALQELEAILSQTSTELGLSLRDTERATILLENALRAMMKGEHEEALRAARDASRMAPEWVIPRTLIALAQFQLGRGAEALATCERLLERQPDNGHVLASYARFLVTLGRRDDALEVSDRLVAQLQDPNASSDNQNQFARERAAEAFALLEQDERVVATLGGDARLRAGEGALLLLGAALANLGRREEALELFASLEEHAVASRITAALRRGDVPPGGRFVSLPPSELLPSGMLDSVLAQVLEPETEGAMGQAAMGKLLDEAPTFMPALLASLWHAEDLAAARAVDILLVLGTPEAIDALRAFVTGRLGRDEVRLHAAVGLRDDGHLGDSPVLRLWQEDQLVELSPPRFELLDPAQAPRAPYPVAVRKLMERAVARHEEGDLEAAASAYERVLAIDGSVADAEQHLGLILLLRGDREGAEPHFQRAFELDPEFVLARCTLASLRIGQRRFPEARELLEPLAGRPAFEPSELAAYLFTSAELAAAEGDGARARSQLRLLFAYVPDHEPALMRLRDLERADATQRQAAALRLVQPQPASQLWRPGMPE